MNQSQIGKFIKSLREENNLTQEQLAEKLNVSNKFVSRWENGKTKPNITAMKKLKNFCENNEISFDEIEASWIGPKE